MIAGQQLSPSGNTLSVRIPMTFAPRGGRKRIVGPDGEPVLPAARPVGLDDPLIRALARAWRWKRMLESGGYASIAELAAAEKVNFSLMCRTLRLTMMAPGKVEAVLAGTMS